MMDTEQEKEKGEEEERGAEEERLRRENRALAEELRTREAEIDRLKQTEADREKEVADLEETLKETAEERDELKKALSDAVAAYRRTVVEANPGVLAELVTGDTIEEVDVSLKSARALVEKVRQEVEAEAARTQVPAGAPQRTPPDLSGLSPREKIRYAVGGAS
jgi:septal ring factor EnvC (AmiA/AmiB activator)